MAPGRRCLDPHSPQPWTPLLPTAVVMSGKTVIVGLAVLCHELRQSLPPPALSVGVSAPIGHEEGRCRPYPLFPLRMTNQKELIDQVVALVTHHLRPQMLHEAQSSDSAIRRLANKVRIDRLVRVSRADMMGRPPIIVDHDPAGEWLLQRAQALQVEANAAKPLVLGRHFHRRRLTHPVQREEI